MKKTVIRLLQLSLLVSSGAAFAAPADAVTKEDLKALIERAAADGVSRVRIHVLIDGRDVGETSALEYICPFEEYLSNSHHFPF